MHHPTKFLHDILNSCGYRTFLFFVGLARKRLFSHSLGRKDVIWHIDRQNRSDGATCARVEATKKRWKETDRGKLAIRPDHPCCRSTMWICVCGHISEIVIYSKFHRNPFEGFGATGCRNLPFSIALASGLYNSLYYHTHCDTQNCRLYIHKHMCETTNGLPVGTMTFDLGWPWTVIF